MAISIGSLNFPISLEQIVFVAFILATTFVLSRVVRFFLNRSLKHSKVKTIGVDKTTHTFLKHFITGLVYVVGIGIAIYSIPALRSISISLFAGAGVLAVIVGFASQKAFANIVSGIFIVIFKPFRVGDVIKVDHLQGTVVDITLRHTVICDFENVHHIMPNAVISDATIENRSIIDERVKRHFEIGISYNSDINKAMELIREFAPQHKYFLDGRTKQEIKDGEPLIPVKVISLGDSSVNIRAWIWSKNPTESFILACDLRKQLKEEFDKAGIEIPFPHRTVYMRQG